MLAQSHQHREWISQVMAFAKSDAHLYQTRVSPSCKVSSRLVYAICTCPQNEPYPVLRQMNRRHPLLLRKPLGQNHYCFLHLYQQPAVKHHLLKVYTKTFSFEMLQFLQLFSLFSLLLLSWLLDLHDNHLFQWQECKNSRIKWHGTFMVHKRPICWR